MDVESYSPLAWAYLGDGLWELFVRENLMQESLKKAGDYHSIVVPFASAKTQAQIIKSVWDDLPEKEREIFRRGRNSCSSYRRNLTHQEYAYSTGFEAILGYLYLAGEKERLMELLQVFFAKGKEVLNNGKTS